MTRTKTQTPTFRTGMITVMDDGLYKLTSWLSPAYPVGAYTYSHGLEAAIAGGDVSDCGTAKAWISDCLAHGAGRSDAFLLVQAHSASSAGDSAAVGELIDLAKALAPSSERLLETTAQGTAFADVTQASWGGGGPDAPPYAIAVGVAAARHDIAAAMTVEMFLHAYVSNLISACVRLIPLGQTQGQTVLSELMSMVRQVAAEAMQADIDDIGGCAIGSDIASMRHETQEVRLFRS